MRSICELLRGCSFPALNRPALAPRWLLPVGVSLLRK